MKLARLVAVVGLAVTAGCTGSAPTAPTANDLTSMSGPLTTSGASASSALQQLRAPKPIKITSGTMATTGNMTGVVTLNGPRFSLAGEWADGGWTGCQPCDSGPSGVWTSAGFAAAPVSATVDGVHYDSVFLSGSIRVFGTVNVPPIDTPAFPLTFPFTMDDTSTVTGYASNPALGPASELFRVALRGSGTASIDLTTVHVPGSANVYTARSVTYTF